MEHAKDLIKKKNVSVVVGTMWKSSGTAVQLNMMCSD